MPELPEVETVRRQLEPVIKGHTIVRARVLDPMAVSPATPVSFQKKIKGQRILGVSRRGKYLRFQLGSGDTLVIHLRMTGRLTHFAEPGAAVRRHLRVQFFLDDGGAIALHDQRRFGKALILTEKESSTYWQKLGPEPLERSFNASTLKKILDARKRPVKSLLLEQSLIAGIGNIYADEALFRARIHPLRPAAAVTSKETSRLAQAIKQVLREAIVLEGSSVDTYRTARGAKGRFQEVLRVHRRAGKPCGSCGGAVEKTRVGGRGTYFCPRCQK